ncbi:hypothetical protein GCM10007112_06360 [Vulcanisaeta souniana JCM 11219]|uniref:Uncharacterized protein n=1 Tax=Vulcanisaeta souniana JCM 11219 TaxID=1293586 RepID=A0A830E161_9CREN|nr:hypothetical protein GCM10007112_06360 [Vulcanisaeta souniana JCM 11219]
MPLKKDEADETRLIPILGTPIIAAKKLMKGETRPLARFWIIT